MVPTGPKPRVQRLPGPGSYHGVGLVSTPPVSAQGGVGLVVPNSGLVIPNTMGLVVPSLFENFKIRKIFCKNVKLEKIREYSYSYLVRHQT